MSQTAVLHCNDSKSLWNYTLSPGWTEKEVEVFRLALMKFGMGRWTQIVESRCLPGKTVAQLNNQMQRMIGQQSTGEFVGLHIDPTRVFEDNKNKKGKRKNGCLVNTGDNPTKEQVTRKRNENKRKYAISKEEASKIIIPTLDKADTSAVQIKSVEGIKQARTKLETLAYLQEKLRVYEAALLKLESGKSAKGKSSKKPKKPSKAAAGRTATGKRVSASKENEDDAAMALRLQLEEEQAMDIDDGDFEEIKPKRKRKSRAKAKRSKTRNA